MKLLKKILKTVGIALFVLFLVLYYLFWNFSAPKSDIKVLEKFSGSSAIPVLTYENFKGFEYRKLSIIKDTTLPTLVFVHGTIGSSTDFVKYMKDSALLNKANMISYDRIGYNYQDKNPVQESIAFERDMLKNILHNINPDKTILVGYSYGGPIALAIQEKVRKVILLAPAIYSEVEPMPWSLNLYKWKITRWLVPPIWQEASKEKLSHKQDLQLFENNWKSTPNNIVSIHGTNDWIVPFENSLFLKEQFPENQFELISVPDASHGFIWSKFDTIKEHLIQQLD
ncbi:Pimeloyl-ACP methyl ester carboxylesterase [Tenacibaculum mesophilum]|uniref:Alpha/beta hydrolase n=1 Tax=Tenacibaculum mesophilum TaxID=104268 RepID=A0ABM7CBW5_9FLAO|nr:alpha/beta hydrolase [Tenacibaculum mesophilum]AZJ31218.1 alpha/beta hydrolase [Tenacibaculum mesophilum]QFS29265.1 alpha/beta fold hydrolase [Tenacibaculum mesophilum]SHF49809.1 Pimeloyl-ACP methyl ester carboxylesterase [Tenacibaculum mesophilum]